MGIAKAAKFKLCKSSLEEQHKAKKRKKTAKDKARQEKEAEGEGKRISHGCFSQFLTKTYKYLLFTC